MRRYLTTVSLLLGLVVLGQLPVSAQTLTELWPNQDGNSWTYDGLFGEIESLPADPADLDFPLQSFVGRLIFDGTGTMSPGVEVQSLIGQIDGQLVKSTAAPEGLSPLLRQLWHARPDLRPALIERSEKRALPFWPGVLLGPFDIPHGVGQRHTATRIGGWRDMISDWSWWYLTDELFAGATFTLQLVPDLASDVFLNGTVRGVSESISTGAGSWSNAVVVDYVVDLGDQTISNEGGEVLGTTHSEIRGWVAFVPGIGPVASSEDLRILNVDCPAGCPEESVEGEVISHTEFSLHALPVATETPTWGSIKQRW